jgi:hypothetical protein
MQIATAIDVATNCYEFKVAMDKGDVDGAIAAGVAVGMAAVPGQKLIPAPLRKAVHGVVTKSVTRILHSKYGQAAVKAGGELVDAASSKVQNIANRVTDSSLVKGAGKKLEDWGVSKGGKATAQQAEQNALHQAENTGKNIDLRVKPKGPGGVDVKKGEQPWVVQEGQEWKNKIIGKAQKTGTEGHSFASYREAIKQAKKEEVEAVLMNRGYNRLVEPEFGFKISPNRRPDVLVKTKDGKIHAYEVPSKSDKIPDLQSRNNKAMSELPKTNQGRVRTIDIKKAPE